MWIMRGYEYLGFKDVRAGVGTDRGGLGLV